MYEKTISILSPKSINTHKTSDQTSIKLKDFTLNKEIKNILYHDIVYM